VPKDEEWLKEWNRTIGASRAAAVLGISRYRTPAQVFDEMQREVPPRIDSPDLRRGELLEPIALQLAQEVLGREIEPHDQSDFVYNYHYPWAHALPDGWVGDEVCEVKVPRPATWQRIYMTGMPDEHMVQLQHQMAVIACRVVHYIALEPVTMQVLTVPVERDDSVIAGIMEREQAFWEALKRGQRPSETPSEALDLPRVEGILRVIDSDDAVRAARAYAEMRQLYEEADALLEEAKQRLIAVSGDADAFEIRSGADAILRCYHREQAGGTTFDTARFKAEHPELFAQYQKPRATSRPFRAYVLEGGQS